MNVWIARDGEQIGEYPREQLDRMAQAKELQKSDHYWHDGMDNWRQLDELLGSTTWESVPPPPPVWLPPRRIAIMAGCIAVALVLVIALAALLASRNTGAPATVAPSRDNHVASGVLPTDPTRTDSAVRDRATDELVRKLGELPTVATPPSYTSYDSVSIEIPDPPAALSVTIRGSENAMNPDGEGAISRSDFVLTADFRRGRWFFRQYHETVSDLVHGITTQMDKNARDAIPPAIVSILGLATGAE